MSDSSSSTTEEEGGQVTPWETTHFGLECQGYKWKQTVHSVEVYIPKDPAKSGKDYEIKWGGHGRVARGVLLTVKNRFTPESLLVKLKGADKPLLEGALWQKIKVAESLWMVEEEDTIYEGRPYIMVYLFKWIKRDLGTGKDATAGWWRSLLQGGPFLQAGTPPSAYYLTRDKRTPLE